MKTAGHAVLERLQGWCTLLSHLSRRCAGEGGARASHIFRQPAITGLSAVVLAASACNYAKPMMYIDVVNNSGHAVENLELQSPGGSFGMPELRSEETHKQMAPFGSPCNFSIAFVDQAGKKYAQNFDLGTKCPTEVAFEVGPAMSISARRVRP